MTKFRVLNRMKPKPHPAAMVFDDGKHGVGYNITHNPPKGKKLSSHQLLRNPKRKDKRNSYLVHERTEGEIGKGKTFSAKVLKGYRLCFLDALDLRLIEKAKKEGKAWDTYHPLCLGDKAYRRRKRIQRRKKYRILYIALWISLSLAVLAFLVSILAI